MRVFGLKRRKRSPRNLPALVRYDDDISVGRSPTIREIETLARKAGFRSLLNLNTEGEPGQVVSPNVEATWAHTFDMYHERVSVDPLHPRRACVDRFLETLGRIAKPVFVPGPDGLTYILQKVNVLRCAEHAGIFVVLTLLAHIGNNVSFQVVIRPAILKIPARIGPESPR